MGFSRQKYQSGLPLPSPIIILSEVVSQIEKDRYHLLSLKSKKMQNLKKNDKNELKK